MAASPHLRALIATRFPSALPDATTRRELLGSGWPALDRVLDGGLARGELLWVHASWGGGGLSLASAWARHAATCEHDVLVVDARGSTLPHAWVRPEGRGAIWVTTPGIDRAWLALDLAIRAGGFELVVALDAPRTRDAARVRRLVRERETRLVLVGDVAPMRTSLSASVCVDRVRWVSAPHGDAPASRTLRVLSEHEREEEGGTSLVEVHTGHTDRLRPRPRAPDRSTSRHAKPR